MKKKYISPVCLSCVIDMENMICQSQQSIQSTRGKSSNSDFGVADMRIGGSREDGYGMND